MSREATFHPCDGNIIRPWRSETERLARTLLISGLPTTIQPPILYNGVFGEPATLDLQENDAARAEARRVLFAKAIPMPTPVRRELAMQVAGVRSFRQVIRKMQVQHNGIVVTSAVTAAATAERGLLVEFESVAAAHNAARVVDGRVLRWRGVTTFKVHRPNRVADDNPATDFDPVTGRPCVYGMAEHEVAYLNELFGYHA